ncbi:MAG: amidase family protein [Kangiellaceae bacterium]|jgi:fatty acid amide hydrolase|nr:amidase family protein [Kangiellaceae bacterium]
MLTSEPAKLIAQLQSGTITSQSITDSLIDAIKKNSSLNAMPVPFFREAQLTAHHQDRAYAVTGVTGDLHGLPITVKECFDIKGSPTTFGLISRKSDYPDQDDIYVQALKASGAVVMGKTNVAQLLAYTETSNKLYGRTHHPQNEAYSCGGSSGGEAALVGAGLSALGIGTDIGGSVRIPAALCGACSIKPTTKRLIDKTRAPELQQKLPIKSVVGPISQDAFTLHSALSIMNNAAAAHWPVKPLRDYRDNDISRMKIGYFIDDGIFPVANSVRDAVEIAVERLSGLGAEIVEYRFPDLTEAEDIFYGIMSIDNAKHLFDHLESEPADENLARLQAMSKLPRFLIGITATLMKVFGQAHQGRVLSLLGRYSEQDIPQLEKAMANYTNKVKQSMATTEIGALDAVLSPILPVSGYLHNSFREMGLGGSYSLVNNLTGFPAGVACVGTVSEQSAGEPFGIIDGAERRAKACSKGAVGLPKAVQITANPWREDIILALIDNLHIPFTQAYGK